jgi:hypothetical protein
MPGSSPTDFEKRTSIGFPFYQKRSLLGGAINDVLANARLLDWKFRKLEARDYSGVLRHVNSIYRELLEHVGWACSWKSEIGRSAVVGGSPRSDGRHTGTLSDD